MCVNSNSSTINWLAVIIGLVILGSVFMGCSGSNDDYFNGQQSAPSTSRGLDTSESHRRAVTDKMIEQGTDPNEAEAFTSELFKAQREWERENGR
jgi:hypothetical protein